MSNFRHRWKSWSRWSLVGLWKPKTGVCVLFCWPPGHKSPGTLKRQERPWTFHSKLSRCSFYTSSWTTAKWTTFYFLHMTQVSSFFDVANVFPEPFSYHCFCLCRSEASLQILIPLPSLSSLPFEPWPLELIWIHTEPYW